MNQGRATLRWDAEYRNGRYAADPPLPFVAEIPATLDEHPALRAGVGLYVDCGNHPERCATVTHPLSQNRAPSSR